MVFYESWVHNVFLFQCQIHDDREDLEDEDTALAFLYVSDDMEWGRKNIKSKGHKDIFFVGMKIWDSDLRLDFTNNRVKSVSLSINQVNCHFTGRVDVWL